MGSRLEKRNDKPCFTGRRCDSIKSKKNKFCLTVYIILRSVLVPFCNHIGNDCASSMAVDSLLPQPGGWSHAPDSADQRWQILR